MTTHGSGSLPCQHSPTLGGRARLRAVRECAQHSRQCRHLAQIDEEVWLDVAAARRLQYLPDDPDAIRAQVDRVMAEVWRCATVAEPDFAAPIQLQRTLDYGPAAVVMTDLLEALRRRDNAAGRANRLRLVAYAVSVWGYKPRLPGAAETLEAAQDAIMKAVPEGRERDLVLATADRAEEKVYAAVDSRVIRDNFDRYREDTIATSRVDELRYLNPAAARNAATDRSQGEGAPDPSPPSRSHPRAARSFSELAGRGPEGGDGQLPKEVAHLPAHGPSPEEEVQQRELRHVCMQAIADYADMMWKRPGERHAKVQILCQRLIEWRPYREIADGELARAYNLSPHAIELMVSRALDVLAWSSELQRQYQAEREEPPKTASSGGMST